jgi:hypothetical protein
MVAKRRVVLLFLFLIGIPAVELAREYIAYMWIANKLETAYQRIKPNMTREEVTQVAGTPDSVKEDEHGEHWYWDAVNHQGGLWRFLGLGHEKGHDTLVVEFNEEGKAIRIWGGIN